MIEVYTSLLPSTTYKDLSKERKVSINFKDFPFCVLHLFERHIKVVIHVGVFLNVVLFH